MTADNARRLTAAALDQDGEKAKLILNLWNTAIEKAANAGERSVRESGLPTLRTPVPAVSYWAARERLKAEGFKVAPVQEGPNESTYEVSW